MGGGSLTALPVIETQAGDVSAYIPTNARSPKSHVARPSRSDIIRVAKQASPALTQQPQCVSFGNPGEYSALALKEHKRTA